MTSCACVIRQVDKSGWVACGGGVNSLHVGMNGAAGWGLETLLTFLLVFTVLAATDEARAVDTAHLPVRLLTLMSNLIDPYEWLRKPTGSCALILGHADAIAQVGTHMALQRHQCQGQ